MPVLDAKEVPGDREAGAEGERQDEVARLHGRVVDERAPDVRDGRRRDVPAGFEDRLAVRHLRVGELEAARDAVDDARAPGVDGPPLDVVAVKAARAEEAADDARERGGDGLGDVPREVHAKAGG